jgi:MinD-like ATPase involved in chromosome partitioning or flagellar assembly
VGQAVVQQVPFTILAPQCPAARDVETLAARILGGEAKTPPARRRQGFWARIGLWGRSA